MMAQTPARTVGVQSYCFRYFKDLQKVCRLVREIGVDSIELCGVHADFNDPAKFADVVAQLSEAGIRIVSLGVQTFTGDAAKERKWFECARRRGPS